MRAMPTSFVPLLALAPSIPGVPAVGGFGTIAAAATIPVAGAIYVLLFWGKRSAGECSWREDEQIGLKVIVGTLIMMGTALLAGGFQGLLHLLLTFKNFGPTLKVVLPDLLVGAAVLGGSIMFAVPKTNHAQQPKALRLTAGAIALVGAVATVMGFDTLLKTIFLWPSWSDVVDSLTSLITSVAVFGGAGYMYAKMIGVEVPDIPMPQQPTQAQAQQYQQPAQQQYQAAPQQAAPQQAYQQPAQQQYQQPPQQQAYPSAPPQGGGYPPPQGGGYPPQQGGSAPPRPGAPPAPGGGGYPPPGYGGQ
jgi:hypothetical protein